jgi:hypothetical protein
MVAPIVAAALATGEIVSLTAAAYGDFDFDGRRLAYLRSSKSIAIARIR